MAPTPAPYPQPKPPLEPAARESDREADPAVAKLQQQIKWLMAGLVGCLMLIFALGALSFVSMKEYAAFKIEETAFRTQQKAIEQQQLTLLRQLQNDLNAVETDPPQNPAEAYGQLRESLGVLQDLYGPMADYDITDPDGSLDRIFKQFEESRRNRGGDPQRDDDNQ